MGLLSSQKHAAVCQCVLLCNGTTRALQQWCEPATHGNCVAAASNTGLMRPEFSAVFMLGGPVSSVLTAHKTSGAKPQPVAATVATLVHQQDSSSPPGHCPNYKQLAPYIARSDTSAIHHNAAVRGLVPPHCSNPVFNPLRRQNSTLTLTPRILLHPIPDTGSRWAVAAVGPFSG